MANAARWPLRIVLVASAGALAAAPGLARADDKIDKQACVSAYEEGQQLRKDGKLLAARARLLVCAQESCPAILRNDCTVWVAEVEQSTPSVVLAARSPSGHDLVDVDVSVDGKPLTKHLDGKALSLDPGPHTFRFELAGSPLREETVLVHEGERSRQVLADFQLRDGGPPAGTSSAAGLDRAGTLPMRDAPTPAGVYVLGGLGVAGFGVFTAFGLMGLSAKSELDARACKPACPSADVDDARKKFLVADVGLGVGVVSLALAAAVFLGRGEVPAAEPRIALDVGPARGGGSVGLRGAF